MTLKALERISYAFERRRRDLAVLAAVVGRAHHVGVVGHDGRLAAGARGRAVHGVVVAHNVRSRHVSKPPHCASMNALICECEQVALRRLCVDTAYRVPPLGNTLFEHNQNVTWADSG